MRQYARFKASHPDCVLFFRIGDFYEMFDDDAKLAHRVLGITLTQRTEGVPMAGVPYHAVENYLRRMIEAGHRVAVCEQVQDAAEAKGIVDRAVTRVVTPGTLIDESLLDESSPNVVAAIQFTQSGEQSDAVLAAVELSTGSFTIMDLPAARILDELTRLAPSELIHVQTADGNPPPRVAALHQRLNCALTPRPTWTFRPAEAFEALAGHYGVRSLAGFGLADSDPAVGPAGALMRYLRDTQSAAEGEASSANRRSNLSHLRPPKREAIDQFVVIDASTLASLEIERTMRSGSVEGSLLWVLQRCKTSMGKRLLRHWLRYPLRDRARIEHRQHAVAVLLEDSTLATRLIEQLSSVQDVARMVGRISMNRALPRDLVALGSSIIRLAAIGELIADVPAFEALTSRLAGLAKSLDPLANQIGQQCVDSPPPHMREGGLFRDGIDAELDEARTLQRDSNQWLAAYQKTLIDVTGINSLKVGYNQVFGYYIEITHANATKVPDSFSRKQTLRNAERYITPELKTFEEKITTAEARAIDREKLLFERLCKAVSAQCAALSEFADIVAQLDVLACFAEVARRNNYVRPQLADEPVLDIRQGRHPVLDRTLGDRFVPNDCSLHPSTLALITGPNMAGKSTFIRQVALIVLLAHTGCFIPAQAATIGLADRIFTRIGAADELHAGQSTFMVEMTETANILHHATDRSVVILDEIGRGTSTLDGLSLAWAIAETLAARGCRTLFATHYHELTTLADQFTQVANLHVSVREWGSPGQEQIVFLYRILPGRTDRSYGIHVAKIAGLPKDTIRRASELLETLAVHSEDSRPGNRPSPAPAPANAQLGLFTEYLDHPVVGELRDLNLDAMTPMQAFDALRRLKDQLSP